MLREVRGGRIHLFVEDCWMLRDWVVGHIGLDGNGLAPVRRLDLAEMESYSAAVMECPDVSSDEYRQAKTMYDGVVRTLGEMSPVARLEYWDCLNPNPVEAD